MTGVILLTIVSLFLFRTSTPIGEGNSFRDAVFTDIGPECEIGQGAHWDANTNRLYWVCKTTMDIHSYDPVSGQINTAHIDTNKSPLAFVIPLKDSVDKFVVGLERSIGVVTWNGRSNVTVPFPTRLKTVEDNDQAILNYGKADVYNQLWIGSTVAGSGSNKLYHLDEHRRREISETLQLIGAFDWDKYGDDFYVMAPLANKVFQYTYKQAGRICSKKILIDLTNQNIPVTANSLPNGLTVDKEQMLWATLNSEQMIVRIDPDKGKLSAVIEAPVGLQPTSLAFGGSDLNILFLTTAWEGQKMYPNSGKLVRVDGLGVQGLRAGIPAEVII